MILFEYQYIILLHIYKGIISFILVISGYFGVIEKGNFTDLNII